MLELYKNLQQPIDFRGVGCELENNAVISKKEQGNLQNISDAIVRVVGDDSSYKVVLMGGVALRLLEKFVGIPNKGIFSGKDTDLLYCDTDEETFRKLFTGMRSLTEIPQINLKRFLREDEIKRYFSGGKIVQDQHGNLSSTSLFGHVRVDINTPLEILELKIGDCSIHSLSPAILFHLYALRAVGGVKMRDWKEEKHKRLIRINRRLNQLEGFNLMKPSDYPELRQARKLSRRIWLSKVINIAICTDEILSYPYERIYERISLDRFFG